MHILPSSFTGSVVVVDTEVVVIGLVVVVDLHSPGKVPGPTRKATALCRASPSLPKQEFEIGLTLY